ncbi:hypothetical protein RF11_00668 [Thelohanellus kitauei]|uniref:Uncharacterized protein n=1 Tax=Thelohanellus kitauei TaxID=669202 RepID=A0A0C2ND63_THEKT|nr:hypothetical protein RF11_00668 [Thelohanellus kitauei]
MEDTESRVIAENNSKSIYIAADLAHLYKSYVKWTLLLLGMDQIGDEYSIINMKSSFHHPFYEHIIITIEGKPNIRDSFLELHIGICRKTTILLIKRHPAFENV